MSKLVMILAIVFTLVAAAAFGEDALQTIPALSARVTDLTGTLGSGDIAALESTLAALEQRKGAQIAILMVPTTEPETIEQYATRVFDRWKLGRKNVDDGVLVLVAKNDRRVRIEVAYGLEGAIPDAAAKRIAHDYISPKFRSGDFAGGLASGIAMLTRLVDDEPLPEPSAPEMPWWNPVYLVIGFLLGGITAVLVLIVFTRPRIHRALLGWLPQRGRTFAIGVVNAVPLAILMRNPLTATGALLTGWGLASVAGLSRPPESLPSRRRARAAGAAAGSTGYDSGGSSSSSSGHDSGSSSSGSDFSGGGGSSGGGGASDSW